MPGGSAVKAAKREPTARWFSASKAFMPTVVGCWGAARLCRIGPATCRVWQTPGGPTDACSRLARQGTCSSSPHDMVRLHAPCGCECAEPGLYRAAAQPEVAGRYY